MYRQKPTIVESLASVGRVKPSSPDSLGTSMDGMCGCRLNRFLSVRSAWALSGTTTAPLRRSGPALLSLRKVCRLRDLHFSRLQLSKITETLKLPLDSP